MTDFGDFESDDAFDADGTLAVEQLVIRLRRLYAALGPDEHEAVGRLLVAWLRRQGAVR